MRSRKAPERGAAQRRLLFLAELRALLRERVPGNLKQLLVAFAGHAAASIADYCIVDLRREGGTPWRAEIAHADRSREELLRDACRRFTPGPGTRVEVALATGQPSLVVPRPRERLALARDVGDLAFQDGLVPTSYMTVPVVLRGPALAVVTFVTTGNRLFNPSDLDFAVEAVGWVTLVAFGAESSRARQSGEFVIGEDVLRAQLEAQSATGVSLVLPRKRGRLP